MKTQFLVILASLLISIDFGQTNNASMPYDYEKAWQQVAEFENKGLPESALKTVNTIYEEAKKEQNAPQLVKAIIHQLKFTDYKEENAFVKNLNRLRDEANAATFPAKPLLHSMLAEMYWQYYENNRYRFNNRSEITTPQQDDIETWSLNKIVEETLQQYKLSLQDSDKSKNTRIDFYEPVMHTGNARGRSYRPTLFDFLAHRALTFASGSEADITQPVYAFVLDQEAYLADAATFADLDITTQDAFSLKYFAVQLFQELTRLHLNDQDPEALVDLEIARITFMHTNLVLPDKDKLYQIALEKLEQQYLAHPVSTRVTFLLAQTYVEQGQLYKPLQSEAHKWDLKKAFEIAGAAKKRFSDSDGAIQCENLQRDLQSKAISAVIEVNNIPGELFRALVRYKNVTDLHYRIIKTTREEVQTQRRKWERKYDVDSEEKFIGFFLAKSPVKTGRFILPDDGDYQQHSLEVKLDALPVGEYMVVFSHRPDFTVSKNGLAYAFTSVSNISFIHRSTQDGSTEVFVRNRQSGQPLAGVVADLYSSKYNSRKQQYEPVKSGSYKSDAKGYFRVPYRMDQYGNFSINFSYRNDRNSTDPIDKYSYYGGSLYQQVEHDREKRVQTFFFLDRAIYRPGQTIYFKGLVVNTDGKTSELGKKSIHTVTLYDVNNQARGSVQVTTNEYGTFSGTFTAPSTGLTGQMSLQTESGTVYFSVEEYKRPKFEVTFEPVKGSFRLDETIKAEGFARAYSGANIDGAAVSYRVVRMARYPYWWWCRWGYYPNSPEMEITNGKTETDADGKFVVNFQALPDSNVDRAADPVFDYTVYADVTDINGETHSSRTTIAVGYKALQVGVNISNINKDQVTAAKEFTISTTNLAGQFEAAKGNIKIFELKAPAKAFRARLWEQPDRALYTREQYYQFFPVDLFEDETNKFKWERAKEVFGLNFNTAEKKTFVLENLNKWKSGEYVLEIKALDASGQEVKEVSYFTVSAPSEKTIPTPQVKYFQPIKMTAEPGEKASFAIGTADKKIIALYEVERDGELLKHEWIELKNEQRVFEVPITEADRGNLGIHVTFIKDNRLYKQSETISVPFSNKNLNIAFESFRDKLQPGQQEQWKIRIKGNGAEKVVAEMVATLYDESLDQFRSNSWYANFFNSHYVRLGWSSTNGFNRKDLSVFTKNWNPEYDRSAGGAYFDSFNWFGYSFYDFYYGNRRYRAANIAKMKSTMRLEAKEEEMMDMMAAAPAEESVVVGYGTVEKEDSTKAQQKPASKEPEDFSAVKVRTNFNETAFFYPHLQTNAEGEIIINFTVPEALTRWKMLGFAHTPDLKSGSIVNHLVTQKELMVVPNQPRFFRENDKMIFAVKVSSLVDAELTGQAQLEFFDALTMKAVDVQMKNNAKAKPFALKPRQSTNLEWSIEIPEGVQAILYRIVAKAGNFSDGEEMTIPVVTNSMLVTESLPLPIRGKQTKTFKFEKMVSNKSKTLRHHRFTLEFTSNPAWYAIQSLPYLMEYPYDCVEQTYSKFYANSIAAHIANSNPRIKQVFDTWATIQPDALLSNLEKNQELKSALLEETPWVLQAKDESQRKRNVGLLFDLNRMANEQERALDKIMKAQNASGGFSWFPGFKEDRYMTQHIVSGMGHLDVLGVRTVREDARIWSMVTRAVDFLDYQIKDDYDELKARAKRGLIKLEDDHLGYSQIHYLYMRSYFKDVAIPDDVKEAFTYYLEQAKKYWLRKGLYMEGMLSLALHRFDDKVTPAAMIKSFSERALRSEEMGMYWKTDRGYFWYQAPIETQALMIEVYDEVAKDLKVVEELKVWLLKQKQTQDWKTTKATTEACYALLRRGTDVLATTKLVDVKVGNETIDPTKREDTKVEAGTGYFKTAWQAGEIKSDMGRITLSKTDDGVAWGAAYWQYFEQLDKITPAETPLKLKKQLFKQENTDRGPVITAITEKAPLQVGDLVKVRIELRVDRDMEYVHLKDMRAAGFEPTTTISTYKYQDGLYYYESTRDLATNFFIGYLGKGTYVFEYDLRVSQKGDFSNGLTTIQCMYAPEFASHSEGIRVVVK